jgi:TonB family protein
MIKYFVAVILFVAVFFQANSQGLKKIKESSKNPDRVFTYHVLKGGKTKQGPAEIRYQGQMGYRVKGQYSEGNKAGTWEYFDSQGNLIQRYNFTTETFEYLKDFKSLQAVFILKDKELVPLETGAMPVLLGGDSKINYFLANNLEYPLVARRKGVEGTVAVIVTITKEGKIARPFIPIPGDKSLDDEALRVISLIQGDWIPLLINGNPTDSLVLFHVRFRLS